MLAVSRKLARYVANLIASIVMLIEQPRVFSR